MRFVTAPLGLLLLALVAAPAAASRSLRARRRLADDQAPSAEAAAAVRLADAGPAEVVAPVWKDPSSGTFFSQSMYLLEVRARWSARIRFQGACLPAIDQSVGWSWGGVCSRAGRHCLARTPTGAQQQNTDETRALCDLKFRAKIKGDAANTKVVSPFAAKVSIVDGGVEGTLSDLVQR